MLLELSVQIKGKHHKAGDPAADLNRILSASGLHYKNTLSGAVLEGSWEQLMAVAKKCHDEILKTNSAFITQMKAVDKPCSNSPAHCSEQEIEDAFDDQGEWLLL
jgi:uncharacterized protein YqgV (UPF0045/DUF77 family)